MFRITITLTMLAVLIGCQAKENYRVYTELAGKEKLPFRTVVEGGTKEGHVGHNHGRRPEVILAGVFPDKLTYSVPNGWQEKPGDQMRIASFDIRDTGEVTLIAFPGDGGGLDANIHRWEGQVNADDCCTVVEARRGDLPYTYVEILQSGNKGIIGAIYQFEDKVLFVKIMGDVSKLSELTDAFKSFCDSIK